MTNDSCSHPGPARSLLWLVTLSRCRCPKIEPWAVGGHASGGVLGGCTVAVPDLCRAATSQSHTVSTMRPLYTHRPPPSQHDERDATPPRASRMRTTPIARPRNSQSGRQPFVYSNLFEADPSPIASPRQRRFVARPAPEPNKSHAARVRKQTSNH
ncbi:hypothetical protein T440DRAFT_217989 [Plenodomus tracheiphilus IPT5]|uniref:Uncharacterized protein n=1 Tax=Plenodomus tracheiphilus IPT5 TaxID=1408161 RepID=A0A6A7AX25_9PLEO|nr:hypothetical protein T440DRAFT_217989 [Plenodomus tracheiphilus IPT5]